MSKFKSDKVMPRYFAIAVVMTLIGFAIVGKAMYIMTAKKQYWSDVAARLKRDSVIVKPNRGNILSSDGQLMASSIPEYKIYMDFQAGTDDSLGQARHDSIWEVEIDSICDGLNKIFPKKTAAEFKAHLLEGKQKVLKNGSVGARHWAIWPRRIDYNTFCEVRMLPIFKERTYKGGFHWEEFNARRKPFTTLARRTIGDLYGEIDSAKNGLELAFDKELRGTNGLMHRRKVLQKYLDIPVLAPIDGADIVTMFDHMDTSCYSVCDLVTSLDSTALSHLDALMQGFIAQGNENDITVIGAYRTMEEQNDKFNSGLSGFAGGCTDYHSARTFDIGIFPKDGSSSGYYSSVGNYSWIDENAADNGFILRYPEGKENFTGERARTYTYRYVGQPHAAYIKQHDLCLEEYLNEVKDHKTSNPLEITAGNELYNVYYVPAMQGGDTEVPVPTDKPYTISGDNAGGFVVSMLMN